MADEKTNEAQGNDEESLGTEKKETEPKEQAKDEEGPFGKDIEVVMHVVYNKTNGEFGVIGMPGFLNDKTMAYASLKMAEKQLDSFYSKKENFKETMMKGVRNFSNKAGFRKFINGRRR